MNALDRMFDEGGSCAAYARRYARRVAELLEALDFDVVDRIAAFLAEARAAGRRVFFVGNGGSAATSSHFANDLGLGTRAPGAAPARAISLTDNLANLTALANDEGYERVFVGQLDGLFEAGDVLVALSASGNSPNILRAVEYANDHGGTTIGLVGFDGGKLRDRCHICLQVKTERGEYGPVEDIHVVVCHMVTTYLKRKALG